MRRKKSIKANKGLVQIPGPTVLKNSMHWRYRQQLNNNFGDQKFECKPVHPNGAEVRRPYKLGSNSIDLSNTPVVGMQQLVYCK